MLEDILSQGFQALSIPFTAETLSAFRRYSTILAERNRQMNLTAITSEDESAAGQGFRGWYGSCCGRTSL